MICKRRGRGGGRIADNTQRKGDGYSIQEASAGEGLQAMQRGRHRLYKTKGHRGGSIADNTKEARQKLYKTRGHRQGNDRRQYREKEQKL